MYQEVLSPGCNLSSTIFPWHTQCPRVQSQAMCVPKALWCANALVLSCTAGPKQWTVQSGWPSITALKILTPTKCSLNVFYVPTIWSAAFSFGSLTPRKWLGSQWPQQGRALSPRFTSRSLSPKLKTQHLLILILQVSNIELVVILKVVSI